jgi:maltose-binding protein MalE
MINNEKTFMPLVLFILASFLINGCSFFKTAKTNERQSLLLWVDANRVELDYYNSRISCYCEMNKNVDIKVTGIPFSDIKPSLLGQGNVGESPDIIYVSSDWIGELADRKLIKPLISDNLKTSPLSSNSSMISPLSSDSELIVTDSDRAESCVSYEGNLYAIPVAWDVVTLLVNRDLVPTDPLLIEDLFASAPNSVTISAETGPSEPSQPSEVSKLPAGSEPIWPLVYDNKNFYYHGPFYFAFNGTVPQQSGDTLFKTEPLVDSLLYALALETERKVLPVSLNHSAMMSLFCNKKAKAMISGPWDFIKARNSGIHISPVPLPEIEPGHRMRSFVSVHGLALAANTTNDAAALDFIKFLSSDESQAIASSKIGIVPASLSLCESNLVEDWVKVFRKEVDKGVIMPNTSDMAQVWRQVNWVLAKCFTDKPEIKTDIKTIVNKASESAAIANNIKSMSLKKRGMP